MGDENTSEGVNLDVAEFYKTKVDILESSSGNRNYLSEAIERSMIGGFVAYHASLKGLSFEEAESELNNSIKNI